MQEVLAQPVATQAEYECLREQWLQAILLVVEVRRYIEQGRRVARDFAQPACNWCGLLGGGQTSRAQEEEVCDQSLEEYIC